MSKDQPPQWQLPNGVTHGLWEYTQRTTIAEDYDQYFRANRLFDLDQAIVEQYCSAGREDGAVLADLGCGTARALVPMVRLGFRGLAVDLSEHMLEVVEEKAEEEDLPIQCVRGNLVELDCIARDSVQHAICLFSTLGMIRGRAKRAQVLRHIRRIVRPGGRFVIHVHNYWYNLYDPDGPGWLIRNLFASLFRKDVEAGDKCFHYRGVTNMFLHVFRRREIQRDLRRAGFKPVRTVSLAPQRYRELKLPWLFGSLRANGWIIVCE